MRRSDARSKVSSWSGNEVQGRHGEISSSDQLSRSIASAQASRRPLMTSCLAGWGSLSVIVFECKRTGERGIVVQWIIRSSVLDRFPTPILH